jgi:hypothetical protein
VIGLPKLLKQFVFLCSTSLAYSSTSSSPVQTASRSATSFLVNDAQTEPFTHGVTLGFDLEGRIIVLFGVRAAKNGSFIMFSLLCLFLIISYR